MNERRDINKTEYIMDTIIEIVFTYDQTEPVIERYANYQYIEAEKRSEELDEWYRCGFIVDYFIN